jgi:hypothetical protein
MQPMRHMIRCNSLTLLLIVLFQVVQQTWQLEFTNSAATTSNMVGIKKYCDAPGCSTRLNPRNQIGTSHAGILRLAGLEDCCSTSSGPSANFCNSCYHVYYKDMLRAGVDLARHNFPSIDRGPHNKQHCIPYHVNHSSSIRVKINQ